MCFIDDLHNAQVRGLGYQLMRVRVSVDERVRDQVMRVKVSDGLGHQM